ncbi:hypothetical protein PoB_001115200 [Plakobranchus ocellatus]|uniref:Uncharacterized protein n=1 Tax=Plakobranchus ocellatus TaxID=259542 RepID=A0AAV3YNW5_9GAST|nr:hypothetical protein PoB_001115200 [Plakobranchus ocellatus]
MLIYSSTERNITQESTEATFVFVQNTTDAEIVVTNRSENNEDYPSLVLGVAIGSPVLVLCLILMLVYFLCRRKKRRKLPPEPPHPYTLTTRRDFSDPVVIYNVSSQISQERKRKESQTSEFQRKHTSSSSGNVQIVGEVLLPPRKKSSLGRVAFGAVNTGPERSSDSGVASSTMSADSHNTVYGNGGIFQTSRVRHLTGTSGEVQDNKESQDALYEQPNSLQLVGFHSLDENPEQNHKEENLKSEGIDRSRLDSQKYLLPARLLLHMQHPTEMRKKSIDTLPGDTSGKSPSDNCINLQWKASPPIVHHAEEDTPKIDNSPYISMDFGSQISDSVAATPTSLGSSPPPCKSTGSRPVYINLEKDATESRLSPPHSPQSPNHYEPVAALMFTEEYGNANEILKNKGSPIKSIEDKNESAEYVLCNTPGSTSFNDAEKNEKNSSLVAKDNFTAQYELKDNNSTPANTKSNISSDRNSTSLNYVNASEVNKILRSSHSPANSSSLVNSAAEQKHDNNFKKQAQAISKPKKNPQSKPPPVAKKPAKLVKANHRNQELAGDSQTGVLAGIKRAVRTSLTKKVKRQSEGTSASGSTPDILTDLQKNYPKDSFSHKSKPICIHSNKASNVEQSSEHKAFPTNEHSVGNDDFSISTSEMESKKGKAQTVKNKVYQNLETLETSESSRVHTAIEDEDKSRSNHQIAHMKQQKGLSHKTQTLPSEIKQKPRIKNSISHEAEKLDLSEIKSKLKKTC